VKHLNEYHVEVPLPPVRVISFPVSVTQLAIRNGSSYPYDTSHSAKPRRLTLCRLRFDLFIFLTTASALQVLGLGMA
jgi:hypothetical protein